MPPGIAVDLGGTKSAKAVLLVALLACTSAAHGEDWPYVQIVCMSEGGQVSVEERVAQSAKLVPKHAGVQDLTQLTELRTVDGPAGRQDHRVRKRDYRRT